MDMNNSVGIGYESGEQDGWRRAKGGNCNRITTKNDFKKEVNNCPLRGKKEIEEALDWNGDPVKILTPLLPFLSLVNHYDQCLRVEKKKGPG